MIRVYQERPDRRPGANLATVMGIPITDNEPLKCRCSRQLVTWCGVKCLEIVVTALSTTKPGACLGGDLVGVNTRRPDNLSEEKPQFTFGVKMNRIVQITRFRSVKKAVSLITKHLRLDIMYRGRR